MAAPGRPNTWLVPSRRRISTAARAAVILGMACSSRSRTDGSARRLAAEALDAAEQRGVVQAAVAVGPGRGHQLGDQRAQWHHHAGLAGSGGQDAEVLVVQVDPEARVEAAGEHVVLLLVQDLGAG